MLFIAALLIVFAAPCVVAHAQEAAPVQKQDVSVVVSHLVQEDSDSAWYEEADFAQGQDMLFSVTGTLPPDLATRSHCPYWLKVRTDTALSFVEGSIRVERNQPDGTSEDVTSSLDTSYADHLVTGGSVDLKQAIPGLSSKDTLTLYYTMRFAHDYRIGLGNGNTNWAHLECEVPSGADQQVGHQAMGQSKVKAQALDDATEDGLLNSPEIKVTVYTYSIDIKKLRADTSEPLAGAQFAVRNEDNRWYVTDKSWADQPSEATVFTTDADGHVRINGLDANSYDLVETKAPEHFQAIGPVDVLIESSVAQQAPSLKVTSRAAAIEKVDAADGTALIPIEDPIDPDNPPASNPTSGGSSTPDANAGGKEGASGGSGSGSEGTGNGSEGSGGSKGRVASSGGSGDTHASKDPKRSGLVVSTGDSLPIGLAVFTVAITLVAVLAWRRSRREKANAKAGNMSAGAARLRHERKDWL